MTGTLIAAALQLTVPSYALRLVRRFGAQHVGWFIVTAFVSLGLLHLVGAPKAIDAGPASGVHQDLIYAVGAVLLLIGMGHMESLCMQREKARGSEERLRSKCEFEARQEITKLARANQELAAEMARRDQTARTLQEIEALYRPLFTENPQPMFLFDLRAGRFLTANHSALRQYGYTQEEFAALKAQDLLPAEAATGFLEELGKPCPGMQSRGFWQHCRKDRSLIDVEVTAVDLSYKNFPARLFLVNEVGQRRHREREVLQTQRMEVIGQIAGGVAHYFNNVLTIVQGYASLAESQMPEPKTAAHLKQISAAVTRAAGLTRHLLGASGRQSVQLEVLDLNALLRKMNQMVRRLVGEEIVFQANYGLLEFPVHGDALLIERIITNLVVNARDAMPEGGTLTISTAMARATHPSGDAAEGRGFIRLTVRDTGCGMTPDVQARLYEPFFTTKDIGKAVGLGLASVYGAVQKQSGWIEFTSHVGAGTEFRVFLPCVSASAALRQIGTTRLVAKSTILLVEPNERMRALARCVLDARGYRVIETDCSSTALLLWENLAGSVDLLLTDATLSDGMSGRDLATQLRQTKPGLKVLFSSGGSPDCDEQKWPLPEGLQIVSKPYSPDGLSQEVQKCLACFG